MVFGALSAGTATTRGPFAQTDSLTLLLQILALQSGFYVILGISVTLSVGLMLGKSPTLASLFAAEPGHIEALPVVFAHVLTAPLTAVLVGSVVGSASQVFDQVATLSTIHLLLRIILFSGFPRNVAFWAAVAFDAFLMVLIGEFIARRRELADLRSAVGSLNEDDSSSANQQNNTRRNTNNPTNTTATTTSSSNSTSPVVNSNVQQNSLRQPSAAAAAAAATSR